MQARVLAISNYKNPTKSNGYKIINKINVIYHIDFIDIYIPMKECLGLTQPRTQGRRQKDSHLWLGGCLDVPLSLGWMSLSPRNRTTKKKDSHLWLAVVWMSHSVFPARWMSSSVRDGCPVQFVWMSYSVFPARWMSRSVRDGCPYRSFPIAVCTCRYLGTNFCSVRCTFRAASGYLISAICRKSAIFPC